jgi:hypothetical protein
MHHLPFDAQMTDKLFRLVQDAGSRPEVKGCLPSIAWVPRKAGWWLAWIPRSDTVPARLFGVDGLTFYISAEVEPLLYDQVFDWDDNRGVVSHAAFRSTKR